MNSQVVTMGISSYQKFFREREKREKREAERQRDRERVTERHRETENWNFHTTCFMTKGNF